tara:strand:+ start:244 stop:492 length:249 start_codon:yes stop_codon:yes gene_type:complete
MKCFICKGEHHFKECKLYKSRICRRFLQGNCTREHCFYAHGKEELRTNKKEKKEKIKDDFLKDCSVCGDKHYSNKCVYLEFL